MNETIAEPSNAYVITLYGKTDERDYRFTEHTVQLWHIWQQIRPKDAADEYAVIGWGHGHKPGPMKTNGISQMIFRRCQEAKILKPFRGHAFRHAKIKRGRQQVGLETTSVLIDHSSLKTTWGYANFDEDELAQAAIKTGLQFDIWGKDA